MTDRILGDGSIGKQLPDFSDRGGIDALELLKERPAREFKLEDFNKSIQENDWQAAQEFVDVVNRGSSQSVLDTFQHLSPAAKSAVELYSDTDGTLKMRLTEKFIREAQEANKVKEAVDLLGKHDLDGLRELLPLNGSVMVALKKEMQARGWEIIDIPRPKYKYQIIGDHPNGGVVFVPPVGDTRADKSIVIMNMYSDRPNVDFDKYFGFQTVEERDTSDFRR